MHTILVAACIRVYRSLGNRRETYRVVRVQYSVRPNSDTPM